MTNIEIITDIRDSWACVHVNEELTKEQAGALFDAWFENEIREAKEAAWDEGRVSGGSNAIIQDNPYREGS